MLKAVPKATQIYKIMFEDIFCFATKHDKKTEY